LIADVHSNLEALNAVLNKIRALDIKEVYCLGDLTGYGADPAACIKAVRALSMRTVLGNHDYSAATLRNIEWFNPAARAAVVWTHGILNEGEKEYLANLPKVKVLNLLGKQLLLVHGSPRNPLYEYVYEEDVESIIKENMHYDVIAMAHTHIPFVKKTGRSLIINCGSVGQPRDRNPKASFAVLDLVKTEAEIIRVAYDVERAAKKIVEAGLPDFLAKRLFLGV